MLRRMNAVARTLSIIGHPVLLLPLAAWLAHARDTEAPLVLAGFTGFGALVMAWSWWQVRRGRWTHVDASGRSERRALNRFLLVALGAGSVLAWRFAPAAVALAIGTSLLLVAAAMFSAPWCKLSLHVAFATYAALLLWRVGPVATVLALAFGAALAWSRWVLERHAPRDLAAGALAGGAAGLMFWRALAWHGGH
jgi:membrane-associated phospholipid phosphatase